MNGISSWFRQFSAKLSAGLRSFMAGRYGTDRLNMVILCAGLFCSLLSVWVKAVPLNIIFWALSYGLMIWAICRTLSRNTYKRTAILTAPSAASWCASPEERGKSPSPAPGARKSSFARPEKRRRKVKLCGGLCFPVMTQTVPPPWRSGSPLPPILSAARQEFPRWFWT